MRRTFVQFYREAVSANLEDANAGNRVRFAGQLLDTSNGAHLWADRFAGELAVGAVALVTRGLTPYDSNAVATLDGDTADAAAVAAL